MVRDIVILLRPQNGLVVALSFAAGWLWMAPASGGLWIGMALVCVLHSAGTIRNDIVDRETDRINMPDRPLASGNISLATAQAFFFGFLTLAIALTILGGRTFLVWGTVIYFAGWLYNEPPFLGSHRPISSITLLALYFTALPFIFGAQAAGGIAPLVATPFIITVLGVSLSRAATALFKDYKDVAGDRATSKKTFLFKFGASLTARAGFLLSIIGGILLLSETIMAKGIGPQMAPAILFIIIGVWLRFRVVRNPEQGTATFGPIFSNEIRLQLSHILWIIWPR
jgi:geranylgeranylglycerol-phosphate geranylgeranyltransferase